MMNMALFRTLWIVLSLYLVMASNNSNCWAQSSQKESNKDQTDTVFQVKQEVVNLKFKALVKWIFSDSAVKDPFLILSTENRLPVSLKIGGISQWALNRKGDDGTIELDLEELNLPMGEYRIIPFLVWHKDGFLRSQELPFIEFNITGEYYLVHRSKPQIVSSDGYDYFSGSDYYYTFNDRKIYTETRIDTTQLTHIELWDNDVLTHDDFEAEAMVTHWKLDNSFQIIDLSRYGSKIGSVNVKLEKSALLQLIELKFEEPPVSQYDLVYVNFKFKCTGLKTLDVKVVDDNNINFQFKEIRINDSIFKFGKSINLDGSLADIRLGIPIYYFQQPNGGVLYFEEGNDENLFRAVKVSLEFGSYRWFKVPAIFKTGFAR